MHLSVLICTLNESKNIELRLENIKSLFVPKNTEITVHVLDNGSTDNTIEIVEEVAKNSKIKIHSYDLGPIGKCGALFWGLNNINSDVYIMTDANTIMSVESLDALVTCIKSAPDCDLFVGNTRSTGSQTAGEKFLLDANAELPYRMKLEKRLKVFSGANGACYAVSRRSVEGIALCAPVRNDDFVISSYAYSQGRVKWLPKFKAFEVENMAPRNRYKQKYRDALGHFQALKWIAKNVRPVGKAYYIITCRLLYWTTPVAALNIILFFLGPKSLALLGMSLLNRRIRDSAIRCAALYVGGVVGIFRQPSVSWETAR